jgi:hypothetical protein
VQNVGKRNIECIEEPRHLRTSRSKTKNVAVVFCKRDETDIIVFVLRAGVDFILLSINIILQPFVEPWPLFSFLIFYTVGMTPWTGDQPFAKPLPAHKHGINVQRHPCTHLFTFKTLAESKRNHFFSGFGISQVA